MANISSTQVLKVLDIPQKYYLANELYVGVSLLLDTETEELILAQNSQNPDVYAELFRIGGNCEIPESWRVDPISIFAGDYTEEPVIRETNPEDETPFLYYPILGGNVLTGIPPGLDDVIAEVICVNPAIPVISDIELSTGLNNVAIEFFDLGDNDEFLDINGDVPKCWGIRFTFSGTYVFVPGQINWVKFSIDGIPCICRVNILGIL